MSEKITFHILDKTPFVVEVGDVSTDGSTIDMSEAQARVLAWMIGHRVDLYETRPLNANGQWGAAVPTGGPPPDGDDRSLRQCATNRGIDFDALLEKASLHFAKNYIARRTEPLVKEELDALFAEMETDPSTSCSGMPRMSEWTHRYHKELGEWHMYLKGVDEPPDDDPEYEPRNFRGAE